MNYPFFGACAAMTASPMRNTRSLNPSSPTLCAVMRAPSISSPSSSASASGSPQPSRRAQRRQPFRLGELAFLDHAPHGMILLWQLDSCIGGHRASLAARGDVRGNLFEPGPQLRSRIAGVPKREVGPGCIHRLGRLPQVFRDELIAG